jgi:hypothetical protein
MKVADPVGVTFVNVVLNRGILNGVVNISLGTYNFTPDDKLEAVALDTVVSSRLRMDLPCARQLHETLTTLLQAIDQETSTPPAPSSEGLAAGKPN